MARENNKLKSKLSKLQASFDSFEKDGVKSLLGQITKRDDLVSALSVHIGTFDHSDKTLDDVAKYGVKKLGIACDSGSELSVLKGYLHGRKPASKSFAIDSSEGSGTIANYLKGERV